MSPISTDNSPSDLLNGAASVSNKPTSTYEIPDILLGNPGTSPLSPLFTLLTETQKTALSK